jgi:hypothetical protein
MRQVPTILLLGGFLLSSPAAAQEPKSDAATAPNGAELRADPYAPGPLTIAPPPLRGPRFGSGVAEDISFVYHGFLSAPIHIALGDRPSGGTPLHGLNLDVPDLTWNTWFYTTSQPAAWANVNLQLGSPHVFGAISIGAWNFSQGQQAPLSTQYAETTISFWPSLNLRDDNLLDSGSRLNVAFGGTGARYGTAGRYDAGAYGTAVIGSVAGLGELASIERDFGPLTLRLEQGVGANSPGVGAVVATTLLAHAHVIATYAGTVRVGLHYLSSWTADDRVAPRDPDGSIKVLGGELRLNGGLFGELYVGGSYVMLNHSEHVGGALQIVHVSSGASMMANFLGIENSPARGNDHGTGSLRNVLFQYDFSLGTLLRYPQPFNGDGPDLRFSLFGMYTRVGSFDEHWDNVRKFKFGTDIVYTPLQWLVVAGRIDRVIPTLNTDSNVTDPSDDFRVKIPGQSFWVFSPRIVVRTSIMAHETVSLQYSRYVYGTMPNGAVGIPQTPQQNLLTTNGVDLFHRPWDSDVFSLRATMWF